MLGEYINQWAGYILKESESMDINESKIPSDKGILLDYIPGDVEDTKFYPTVDFLRSAYELLNEKFYGNKLPVISFRVNPRPRVKQVGTAGYRFNDYEKTVTPLYIFLNSAFTLSLHEWLEVVMHEMVHVCDYVMNPGHFLKFMRKSYDAHGSWFMNYGKQFEQYGFHIQKYCKAELNMNMEDPKL